jgi:RimJ/RimL family protein N-acetyltransferase
VTSPGNDGFLTTDRLTFRTWRTDDVDLAIALWCDDRVARFLHAGGDAPPEGYARERLLQEVANQAEHGFQYWPIFERAGGAHVGCCGLKPREPSQRVLELGFHLRPDFWGRGLAREASHAVIDLAFSRLGARALFAGHHPDNAASQRVLVRLGFRFTHQELYPPTGLHHPCYLLEPPRPR